MAKQMDDTILKMVSNLEKPFGVTPTLKRSHSISAESQSSSVEEINTPVKKFKQELNLNYIGSPREIRRLRSDLLEARSTILNLESRVQHMHNVRNELQLMFENEVKLLKKQQQHDRKNIDDLEMQLQTLRQREATLKEEYSTLNDKYNKLKVSSDEEIEELEKNLSEMKEESRMFESEESTEIVALNRKNAELQMLLDAAEEDAEAQKRLVQELESHLSQKNSVERDLEREQQALQAAKNRIKELENAKENFLEFQELAKSQTAKLANYSELEREVARLKEENQRIKDDIKNKLLLEEEVHDLKSRLVAFKDQEKKLAQIQAQKNQNDLQLDEWRRVARGICESTASDAYLPHLLRSAVERLQQQEISLTSAKLELESQLNAAQFEGKVAKAELEKSQKHLADLKKTEEERQRLFNRMRRKLELVCRERNGYRQQLDLYEKDLTITAGTSSTQMQDQRERIENLEKICDGYRELIAKMEGDLQTMKPALFTDQNSKPEQLAKLQSEIDRLKQENEMLSDRRDQLEIQLERYLENNSNNANNERVVHVLNNPLSECVAEREKLVEKLQDEIVSLKKKVKNLQDGLEASTLNESTINVKEVMALKEQLQNQENKSKRQFDYFKSTLQEFRNFAYMSFGFKIDRTTNALYKLTSIYAERDSDQLLFQLNSEGSLDLLENEFSATLEQMVNLHLRHQKSIPVFLSALTMDLFNNSTMATRTFE